MEKLNEGKIKDSIVNSKLFPYGWILYCPECCDYVCQSDPQNFSGRKTVFINDVPCDKCTKKSEEEVLEAQQIMGRLGLPKEKQ
jgi:hypothetical protein